MNTQSGCLKAFCLSSGHILYLEWADMAKHVAQRMAAFEEMRRINGDENKRTPEGWLSNKVEEFADGFMLGIDATDDADNLQGMIMYRRRMPSPRCPITGAVECLWVSRDHDYGQAGQKLMNRALAHLRKHNVTSVSLSSSNLNKQEQAFLKSKGWTIQNEIPIVNSRIFERKLVFKA